MALRPRDGASVSIERAAIIREHVGHIARGCRSSVSHNPAVHERAIEDVLTSLEKIRPLTEAEWRVIYAEHDVLHAARHLVGSVGVINKTAELEHALKKYDEAVASEAANSQQRPQA